MGAVLAFSFDRTAKQKQWGGERCNEPQPGLEPPAENLNSDWEADVLPGELSNA